MKLLLCLLLLTNLGYAQVSAQAMRRDSVPEVFPPDLMPNARPNNSFYRYRIYTPNTVQATLDNMSVKVPDSSTHYTMMLRSSRKYGKPADPLMQFLRPMKPVSPKKKF